MDVHPNGKTIDQMQAMTHNVATDLGNVQMLLPILQVREPEDVATLIRAQRSLNKAYTELLSLYAKYVPQHTHAGDHDGSPEHAHNGSERGVSDLADQGNGRDAYGNTVAAADGEHGTFVLTSRPVNGYVNPA
jgi:hypothetical protein